MSAFLQTTWRRLLEVCRGTTAGIGAWSIDPRCWTGMVLAVACGAGVYGATIGLWRAPLQAIYTALKFPLLMMLTVLLNALINGMLAQLLGLGISFRQSSFAILTGFAVTSLVLAALSPVALFVLWNTPALDAQADRILSHNAILVTHVAFIAFAGVVGNLRLYAYLKGAARDARIARRILAAWLAGNMFLGCQLSWIMRPFIGSPGLPVEFFRPDAFHGNFYESTFRAVLNLLT